MEKEAADKYAHVLHQAASTIRTQADELQVLREKLAQIQLRGEVEKVAQEMHRKGINQDVPIDMLANDLEKSAHEGNLETIRKAVDMVGPDMGTKIASINENQATGSGSSDLERYLVGGVG